MMPTTRGESMPASTNNPDIQTPNSAIQKLIGWREWVGLPDLVPVRIKAKVDTGARTSALHAFYVEPFERDGWAWVRFGIHPYQRRQDLESVCEARVKDRRMVRDSGGHSELRYVIETRFCLDGQCFTTEVTLTDRENMRFR